MGELLVSITAMIRKKDLSIPGNSNESEEQIYVTLDLVEIEKEGGSNIGNGIRKVLQNFGIENKVLTFTSDSHITNKRVIKDLRPHIGARSIPCALHSINLFVSHVLTNLVRVDREIGRAWCRGGG